LLQLKLVNLCLEVIGLVVSVDELNCLVLQLLACLQLLLQVCDLLGLRSLEILKLTGLGDGGLLCLPRKAMVLKQLLVTLGRAAVDGQDLLVLVVKVTLQVPHLLTHDTILLGHMSGLLRKGLELLGITTKMTPLFDNKVLGVMLQLEQVLGATHHVRPTTVVVVLKDVARLIHACLPLLQKTFLVMTGIAF
jgi:hypothetical protein